MDIRGQGRYARWSRRSFIAGAAALCATAPSVGSAPISARALVIGNSQYQHVPSLPNARDDAMAVAGVFQDVSDDVLTLGDLSGDDLRYEIGRFADTAATDQVSLLYYSGHGVEVDGIGYLLPTDADIATPARALRTMVPIGDTLLPLLGTSSLTVFLGDACRTNPFGDAPLPAAWKQNPARIPEGSKVAVAQRGPTRVQPQAISVEDEVPPRFLTDLSSAALLVAFSSSAGAPALDGNAGDHSPFAKALLDRFSDLSPETSLRQIMAEVTQDVVASTAGFQRPRTFSFAR